MPNEKTFRLLLMVGIVIAINPVFWNIGCNKTDSPFGVYAPNGLDVPSPTPNIGTFYVSVQDLDKKVPFSNVIVLATQPDGAATYPATTGIDGRAAFSPSPVQSGIWTFTIPQQNGFPFITSKMTQALTMANQTVNFSAGKAVISLMPTSLTAYYSNSGGIFTYNLTYQQPNPLCIPVSLTFSTLPINWNVSYGPTTLGKMPIDQVSVTITTLGCVDESPIMDITAIDETAPTGFARSISSPITITKAFSSKVEAVYNFSYSVNTVHTMTISGFPSCSDGSLTWNIWYGTTSFNYNNGCTTPVTFLLFWNNNGGNCVCDDGMLINTNASGTEHQAIECSGGAVTVIGTGPATVAVVNSTQNSNAILNLKMLGTAFPNGLSGSVTLPKTYTGSATIINQNY